MLSFNGQVKVFLAVQPTDMRKSFDTLAARGAPARSSVGSFVRRRAQLLKWLPVLLDRAVVFRS
jgi:hypothetical protein